MLIKPRAAVLLTAFAPPAMPAPIWLPAAPSPILIFVKPFVDMTVLTQRTTTILIICVEINQCVGCRVDGVEDDPTIQRERAVQF
jgi:hypothetical protein